MDDFQGNCSHEGRSVRKQAFTALQTADVQPHRPLRPWVSPRTPFVKAVPPPSLSRVLRLCLESFACRLWLGVTSSKSLSLDGQVAVTPTSMRFSRAPSRQEVDRVGG